MNAVLRRLHNPQGRECGCDADCWCRRTAIGRAVKWWFPARFFGIRHAHGPRREWTDAEVAEWKRSQHEQQGN
jgi:hypothetical protein